MREGALIMAMVVIVEDDPDVASFLEMALKERYDIRVATDGEMAKRVLSEVVPDLVVLDVRLPHTSGTELCRMMRGSPHLSRTPILVVTGYPDSPEASALRDLGVEKILSKPVTARRLLDAVEGALSAAR